MMKNTKGDWPLKPLSEVVDFNPRLDKSAYRDDLEVSFVPMAAVEPGSGCIEVSQTKHFSKVKKGYTPFQENDVLFAKITPCMENGKMAVVPKLSNGLGFGSTEFHVLRPNEGIDSRYIYYFVSSQSFRREAAHRLTGAVGQKRVPLPFLEETLIPVPMFDDQKRIVAEIEKQFSRLDEAVANLKRIKANLKRYKAAVEGKLTEAWRKEHLPAPTSRPGKFYTYAILCKDDSIYIGHTDDIERRWNEHLEGKRAEWTKDHKPVRIAHYEEFDSRQEAADREKWLKTGFGRKWIKREFAASRTRQAGQIEPASKLLNRILTARRAKWKGKGKYKEPNGVHETDLPPLPKGWVWARLEQLGMIVGG